MASADMGEVAAHSDWRKQNVMHYEEDIDNEDEYKEEGEDDYSEDGSESSDDDDAKLPAKATTELAKLPAKATTERATVSRGDNHPNPTGTAQQTAGPSPTTSPFPVGPTKTIPLTTVNPDSKLGCAAAELFNDKGFDLKRELGWQSAVAAENGKIKSFRIEVAQQVDITPFGFMRPSSPLVQILHSVATYATRGGQAEMHNGDYGFVGDRTSLRRPAAVSVDEKMWKWVSKSLGLDVPPLEQYYANPANAKLLYHDDALGGEQTCVPRMIHLPPPFLVFCLEQHRTPFELHQFVARYATNDGSTVTIQDCTLIMDWCFFAAHNVARFSLWAFYI